MLKKHKETLNARKHSDIFYKALSNSGREKRAGRLLESQRIEVEVFPEGSRPGKNESC